MQTKAESMSRVSFYTAFLFLLLTAPQASRAQDIHFSQYDRSPMNLNPALTGQFDGDYRFTGVHRNQWNSVTRPYSTFGISSDAREPLDVEGLGAGLAIYHDITGTSRLRTLKVQTSGSWSEYLTGDSTHSLTGGLQIGVVQKNLVYEDLNFDNQYNGIRYDPSLSTGEDFQRNIRRYPDVNLGGTYRFRYGKGQYLEGGIALYNLFRPEQSFFANEDVRLDHRLNFHARGRYPILSDLAVRPSVLFSTQGTYQEFIFGGEAQYTLQDDLKGYRGIFAGLWYRTRDASFISVGMEYDAWRIGVSYDINVSELEPASRNRGGYEITAIYILKQYERPPIEHRACPTFL